MRELFNKKTKKPVFLIILSHHLLQKTVIGFSSRADFSLLCSPKILRNRHRKDFNNAITYTIMD